VSLSPYAHDAVVELAGGDEAAPGAAITVALCGTWEHDGPCPLAPHHTTAERYGGQLRLRVLFAAEATAAVEVRRRIRTALTSGELEGPDGRQSRWRLVSEGAGEVRPDEQDHVGRLAGG